ncbi:MAG TPA: hypothetical protein VGO47_08110 [Chlamydiales bacterium]|jgi:hypothetical protein|nr:hypothetical protein [Chlamydiales bacterium]
MNDSIAGEYFDFIPFLSMLRVSLPPAILRLIQYIPVSQQLPTDYPDIGNLGNWSVSSHKFGFGPECLRDDNPDTFWQ